MKMVRWATLLLGLVLAGQATATAQIADTIIIDGKEYPLTTNPLDGYLKGRPDVIPKNASRSTANWRGYVATWEIKDATLVLVRMDVRFFDADSRTERTQNIQDKLFPGKSRVPATWYSGALIIPDGAMTQYVHMGYGSTYSHYRIYRIDKGRVIETKSLSEQEFIAYRKHKFAEFKKTDAYRQALADTKKGGEGMSDAEIDDFLLSFFAEEYLAR